VPFVCHLGTKTYGNGKNLQNGQNPLDASGQGRDSVAFIEFLQFSPRSQKLRKTMKSDFPSPTAPLIPFETHGGTSVSPPCPPIPPFDVLPVGSHISVICAFITVINESKIHQIPLSRQAKLRGSRPMANKKVIYTNSSESTH